jgi:hypothetical protein
MRNTMPRRWFQFTLGRMLWLMLVAVLMVYGVREHFGRVRAEALARERGVIMWEQAAEIDGFKARAGTAADAERRAQVEELRRSLKAEATKSGKGR